MQNASVAELFWVVTTWVMADGFGDSQWASRPAELLAVMFALHCFGFLECTGERREVALAIQGGTDNKANDAVEKGQ